MSPVAELPPLLLRELLIPLDPLMPLELVDPLMPLLPRVRPAGFGCSFRQSASVRPVMLRHSSGTFAFDPGPWPAPADVPDELAPDAEDPLLPVVPDVPAPVAPLLLDPEEPVVPLVPAEVPPDVP